MTQWIRGLGEVTQYIRGQVVGGGGGELPLHELLFCFLCIKLGHIAKMF